MVVFKPPRGQRFEYERSVLYPGRVPFGREAFRRVVIPCSEIGLAGEGSNSEMSLANAGSAIRPATVASVVSFIWSPHVRD